MIPPADAFEAGLRIADALEGAEALCIFKLLFFRTKDVGDLERLLAVSGGAIDLPYIRAHLIDMMGGDDPRVAAWDRLCVDHVPAR